MLKCNYCGHLFEEGEQLTWEETHGLDFPPYETRYGCPLCKGDYEEIEPCKICGSYEHEIEEEYCNKCKSNIQKRFTTFVNTEFSPEERELLNYLYDGKDI